LKIISVAGAGELTNPPRTKAPALVKPPVSAAALVEAVDPE